MDYVSAIPQLLVAACCFAFFSLIGEFAAFSQTRVERYQSVLIVNALRKARFLVYSCFLVAVVIGLGFSFEVTMAALVVAALVAMIGGMSDILNGENMHVVRRWLLPAAIVSFSLSHANYDLPGIGSIGLGMPVVFCALMAAAALVMADVLNIKRVWTVFVRD